MVRSNSFTRRQRPSAKQPEERTDDDSNSESRSPTPEHEIERAVPCEDDRDTTSVMQPQLFGWLKKRSKGGNGSWAKRYFFVDETRGTLGYAKGVRGRGSRPSAVLPIADITRVEAVASLESACTSASSMGHGLRRLGCSTLFGARENQGGMLTTCEHVNVAKPENVLG